jgi:hypothetical protein
MQKINEEAKQKMQKELDKYKENSKSAKPYLESMNNIETWLKEKEKEK